MATTDGVGGGEVALEFSALRAAEVEISDAADDLDAVGSDLPEGDFGEAGALIAAMMAAYCEAAAQLVTEGKVIALGARIASGSMALTDTEQAIDFMDVGRR